MSETRPSLPLLGDPMPDVEVVTTNGSMRLPADMKGSWFVLFSHPSDFTPVCTTEFVAFQHKMKEFEALGCKLIALSMDQIPSHIKWVEWIKNKLDVEITFPIIAASESLALKLGMLHPGKDTTTVRAVFVVDPKGILRLMLYYPQEAGRNMDEIVRVVKALQTADTQGSTPADWPDNELIGSDVFMSVPKTLEESKKRMQDYQAYDWWFCHKQYDENNHG